MYIFVEVQNVEWQSVEKYWHCLLYFTSNRLCYIRVLKIVLYTFWCQLFKFWHFVPKHFVLGQKTVLPNYNPDFLLCENGEKDVSIGLSWSQSRRLWTQSGPPWAYQIKLSSTLHTSDLRVCVRSFAVLYVVVIYEFKFTADYIFST
jgi:hypothetical protein